MKIESLSEGNLEQSVSLVNNAFVNQGMENARESLSSSLNPSENRDYLNKTGMSNNRYWVAVNDSNQVVGISGLHSYEYDKEEAIWGGWTCVCEQLRGSRFTVACLLLSEILRKATQTGRQFLRLYAFNDEVANRYKSLGFTEFMRISDASSEMIYLELDLQRITP